MTPVTALSSPSNVFLYADVKRQKPDQQFKQEKALRRVT